MIDIENDLLASIADSARSETFDNFLDHAKSYFKQGKKRESGVITGVVFEDIIRRLSDKHQIRQAGVKLDELISQMAKAGIFLERKLKEHGLLHMLEQKQHMHNGMNLIFQMS